MLLPARGGCGAGRTRAMDVARHRLGSPPLSRPLPLPAAVYKHCMSSTRYICARALLFTRNTTPASMHSCR